MKNDMTDINQIAITSPDGRQERLEQLSELFPDLFDGEGQLDEKALRTLISDEVGVAAERFTFEWAGKHKSKRFAFSPSKATLQFDAKRSLNKDGSPNKAGGTLEDNTSENLIIEGDNLEVLKLLQTAYYEKVKCVFIDPPYNTGNDFIYPDDYSDTKKAYWEKNGTVKDGVKLSTISESSGRRHSNWLNMMQSRLLLVRHLMTKDGAIFVAIDDNELHNLRKLMDEIFGETNFVASIVWKHTQQSKNDEKYFSRHVNYIVCYAQSNSLKNFRFDRTEEDNKNYGNADSDPKGKWRSGDVRSPNLRETLKYPIKTPSGKEISPPENGWRWKPETVAEKIKTGEIIFSEDESRIIRKIYLSDQEGRTPENFWDGESVGTTRQANAHIKEIFDGTAVFDTPKPVTLVERIISLFSADKAFKEMVCLDFFAGSGTLAEAVARMNAKDNGARKSISVQIPEFIDENAEAYKAGYKTISQITIERAKLSGLEIQKENPATKIDTGFRVFKLTDSNFPENLFSPDPAKSEEENLKALEAHLAKATQMRLFDEDEFSNLVTEISLKNGFGLFYELEPVDEILKNKVYRLIGNDKSTLLCLDNDLHDETVEGLKPFKDEQLIVSKFALDTTKKFALQTEFKDNLWVV